MDTDNAITDQDIRNLRTEAGEHGDSEQVALCDIALFGEIDQAHFALLDLEERYRLASLTQRDARTACAAVIEHARALHAEYAPT